MIKAHAKHGYSATRYCQKRKMARYPRGPPAEQSNLRRRTAEPLFHVLAPIKRIWPCPKILGTEQAPTCANEVVARVDLLSFSLTSSKSLSSNLWVRTKSMKAQRGDSRGRAGSSLPFEKSTSRPCFAMRQPSRARRGNRRNPRDIESTGGSQRTVAL